jgi:phosphatidylglycerophosphate synthase
VTTIGLAESDAPATAASGCPVAATVVVICGRAGRAELEQRLLGVTLLRRMEVAAERAGFGGVTVVEDGPGGAATTVPPGRLVVLFGAVLLEPGALRSLAETAVEPERLYHDGKSVAWIETSNPPALLRALSHAGDGPLAGLAAGWKALTAVPRLRSACAIREGGDLARAERWLLARLLKDKEGFMSRHVERKISLAISRRLAPTSVTPNTMTGVSVAVGLAGAAFFLSPRPVLEFAGALIFLLHSILDGCDGELARLKFQESRLGGVLDFWGDNLVHVAVFGCIAVGWSRTSPGPWPLALGGAAIAGTLLSAGLVYFRTMTVPRGGPLFRSVSRQSETRLSRFADHLARRDFIYVVVILAALGKAHWFLALAGFGAPLFFLILLVVARAESDRGLQQ